MKRVMSIFVLFIVAGAAVATLLQLPPTVECPRTYCPGLPPGSVEWCCCSLPQAPPAASQEVLWLGAARAGRSAVP